MLGWSGGEGRSQRKANVKARGIDRPVPLRSFGDGVNRLFEIILSLVNARDGILLIDEFETGLHHTVQADIWRAIFRLAASLNVQVFATTHSSDTVHAFQTASDESEEAGVLVRLRHFRDSIVSTVVNEDDLAAATRYEIEVR